MPALTQDLDEVQHVEAEGVDGGSPALVLLLIDGDGGQPPAHARRFVHVQLHLRPEVLLQEIGDGRAAQPGAHHGCRRERGEGGRVRRGTPLRPPARSPGFPGRGWGGGGRGGGIGEEASASGN